MWCYYAKHWLWLKQEDEAYAAQWCALHRRLRAFLAITSVALDFSYPCYQISLACRLLQVCGVQRQGTRAVDDAQQVSYKISLAVCLKIS